MVRIFYLAVFAMLPTLAHSDEVSAVQYLDRQGKIEVASAGLQVSGSTPFAIASIGKTMTSVALLRLVAQGKISLDDAASDWVAPEIVSGLGGMNGITLRHLLNMTSGLPDYLSDEYIDDVVADPENIQNPLTALSYAHGEKTLFRPGTRFDYSNTNYVLAGLILERVSGLSYSQAIKREVFRPAGMTQSFVFGSVPLPPEFPKGHEGGQHVRAYYKYQGFGDGGVISTAQDVGQFYRALFIEKNLISAAMMAELTHDPLGEFYGLGIDIEGSVYGHSGGDLGFSSDVRIDVETGTIAVILIAQSDANTSWTESAVQKR